MSKQFYFKQFSFVSVRSLNIKTVLFQVIQFSISMHFSSIWPVDRTLSDAATPGQSGPENNSNEGVHSIPQSSRVTGTSASDCLVPYPGHSLAGGSYLSAEIQSVYSTAPADWANINLANNSRLIVRYSLKEHSFIFLNKKWSLSTELKFFLMIWFVDHLMLSNPWRKTVVILFNPLLVGGS